MPVEIFFVAYLIVAALLSGVFFTILYFVVRKAVYDAHKRLSDTANR